MNDNEHELPTWHHLAKWAERQPLAIRIAAASVILDLQVGAEPRTIKAHLCALEEATKGARQ